MAVSEEYKKSFNFLLEYNIKKGVKLDGEKNIIDEDDEATDDLPPSPEDEVADFENTEEINKLDAKSEEELAKEDDLERVKTIQDIQTSKIEELEAFLTAITPEIESLKQRTQDVDAMKDNIEILHQQVKEITPYTPEESLEHMAAISGGISVQDYWNKYIDDNEPMKKGGESEGGEEEKKEYSVKISDINGVNDTEMKNSFYKK